MLYEMRVIGEIMVFAVFKDKDAILLQQILLKDNIWDSRQILQGIRRIGKDKVELLMATLQKTEHIATNGDAGFGVQFLHTVLYKAVMINVLLHADHLLATS